MSAPDWLRAAMARILGESAAAVPTDGLWAIRPGFELSAAAEMTGAAVEPPASDAPALAVIPLMGVMSKRPSLLRLIGLSGKPTTSEVAAAVRAAARNPEVRGILLYVDSPGGEVAGTHELADAVRLAAESKPVHAHLADQGSSAAYWVASQASRVSANATALVGSIGVYCVLMDSSKAASAAGLRFVVVGSGPYKGAGADGVPLTEAQVAAVRENVEAINELFLGAVGEGRDLKPAEVKKLADGREHVAAKALALGLIDAVEPVETALAALAAEVASGAESDDDSVEPPAMEPDEEDPMTPPDARGEQETVMSDKTKPEASGAPQTGAEDEKRSAWAKLGELFGVTTASAVPATTVTTTGLSAEEIDRRIAAGIQAGLAEQAVDGDLLKLQGKATPSAIAKARPVLLKAKREGDAETYGAVFGVLAEADASALLGGEIAAAEQTGTGRAGLGVNATELAALEAAGLTAERVAQLEQKYGLKAN